MSAPFILRPIATTLMIVAILLLGLLGYLQLPVAPLPSVDFPTIAVTTSFPGASPEVVETSVTAPLEHYFGGISGLTSMGSTSSFGLSTITLRFALSRSIDTAAQDVQAQINAAGGWIPLSLLPGPPTYREVNPADTPVITLALTSDVLPLHVVDDNAETVFVQKLSQLSGVGAVTVEGGQTRAIRLQANPAQLGGLGLSLEDVRRAVIAASTDNPKGRLDGPAQAFQIAANDQLFDAAAYEAVIVAYRNGAPVRLRDVGRAQDGVEDSELAGWFNGHPAVILDIQRQPGANAIAVVDAVRALLPTLAASVPPGLHIAIASDRTITIRAAIADVQFTLALTVGLVVLVIFLFLRKLWATVIPSVTLPVSLIATFGAMALCGFSLDNLSLMALTIASGFVVDDAIVMIENIVRHIEAGEEPLQAALKGARQIGFTVISLTLSLVAVFIPLLLMGGIIGRLFREFAITLSLAVIISCFVSLTLTPMMCARLLRAHATERPPGRLFHLSERGFDHAVGVYMRGLDWVLRHRAITMACLVGTIIATAWLAIVVPKGFLPVQDTGLLVGTTDAAQDISFTAMAQRQQAVAEAIRRDPAVVSVTSFVGVGPATPTLNSGRLYIDLGSPDRRPPANDVMARLRTAVAGIPGITLHLQPVQDIALETRASRTQYQYVLQDIDPAELQLWSRRLTAALQAAPALTDVASDQQDDALRLSIAVDRVAAARMGVTMNEIDQALYDAFGQRQIATIFGPLTQYHVILEVDPHYHNDPGVLAKLFVTALSSQDSSSSDAANGLGGGFTTATAPIPLGAFAHFEHGLGPLAITHQGLFPAATISFNLADGASLDQGIAALRRAETQIGLPPSVATSLAGAAAEYAASLSSEGTLVLAAVITVYIVLGALYESFVHPVTILSSLPSAGVGAFAALMLLGQQLDLIALIGLVLLIGIVKKNAIMMVDFALDAQRTQGMTPHNAIREACRLRFRPIMMTTMAALLGALPLALASGAGAELRRPLGIVIVGGLLVSQILTLYTTPVIYLIFDAAQRRLGRRRVAAVP